MESKSDNLLLIVAVIAVIVSLIAGGITYFSISDLANRISGYATGVANLSVESAAVINFTVASIDWGSGRVAQGFSKAYLTTLETNNVTNGNWTLVSAGGLRLQNDGNINVTLNITVGKNASNFIGGTGPLYLINVSNFEPSSCAPAAGFAIGTWIDANTSNNIMNCNIFQFLIDSDAIRIDLNLTVPENSKIGALSDIITATATAAG